MTVNDRAFETGLRESRSRTSSDVAVVVAAAAAADSNDHFEYVFECQNYAGVVGVSAVPSPVGLLDLFFDSGFCSVEAHNCPKLVREHQDENVVPFEVLAERLGH
jgi:hypothetical protein